MTSETFEQAIVAAQASGSYTAAWKKFVKTRFFVPVIHSGSGKPKDFRLHVSSSPEDGKPVVHISEALDRLNREHGHGTTAISGAEIVLLVQEGAAILVALSDRIFNIATARVEWLKKSIQAAYAKRPAQESSIPATPASTPFPQINAAFPEIDPQLAEVPKSQPVAPPVVKPELAPKPTLKISELRLESATEQIRRSPSSSLDVAALQPRRVTNPALGLEFYIPGAWEKVRNPKAMQFHDPLTNTKLEASGFARPGVAMNQWLGMRLPVVTQEMSFLKVVGDSYPIQGEGWRDRIQGVATEYQGIFPGDDAPSHFLIACLRTDQVLICITITVKSDVFEANRPLYKWLLGHVDIVETAPVATGNRATGNRATQATAGDVASDETATPPVFGISTSGRIGRLRFLAYWLPIMVPFIAAAMIAAVILPTQKMLGIAMAASVGVVMIWTSIRLLVLRLHDINRSGKWVLASFLLPAIAGALQMPGLAIAAAGLFWLMTLALLVWPGTPDDNEYGPPCGPNTTWVIVGAAVFIAFHFLSLAAPFKMARSGKPGLSGLMQTDRSRKPDQADAQLVPFSPPDKSFTVDMPGTPRKMKAPSEVSVKGARVTMQMYELVSDGVLYFAQAVDFEKEPDDRSTALDWIRDTFIRTGQGSLIGEEVIRVNGYAGRQVRIKMQDGSLRQGRFALVGSKLCLVMIVVPKGQESSPRVEAFLNSFQIN